MAIDITKDPDAIRVYTFNWAPVVGDKTVTDSEWIPPGDVGQPVIEAESFAAQAVTIRLSGGVNGQDYEYVNRVTFGPDTEVDDQTVIFHIREK